MYSLDDTIFAHATCPTSVRTIVRVTGPNTLECCQNLFADFQAPKKNSLLNCQTKLLDDVLLDARVYLFPGPHSYTGQTLAEIHFIGNPAMNDQLTSILIQSGMRTAGPGEFTARAYLNGKIDLIQAEAVNEIISGTNTFQISAAQRLLSGRFGDDNQVIRRDLLDLLSLIEAGMDFSEEDIQFISTATVLTRLKKTKGRLEKVLNQNLRMESLLHLPSIGIAGVPNAGKSSLFNALLNQDRSLVCELQKTTRDVLAKPLTLSHHECILFDCAGLLETPRGIIDELAQCAALESISHSHLTLFCVDLSKTDWTDDRKAYDLLPHVNILLIGTKYDALSPSEGAVSPSRLTSCFGQQVLPISVVSAHNIEMLRSKLDDLLAQSTQAHSINLDAPSNTSLLTERHKHDIQDVLSHLDNAMSSANNGQDEIVAMSLRAACQGLGEMEQPLDEQILDHVFSRFCVGK
jgi:tRNA modification GTPase